MGIQLHAVLMLLLPALAALALNLLPRWQPNGRQLSLALVLTLLAVVVSFPPAHSCYEGGSLNPVLIGGIALFLTLGWVKPAAWRRLGAGVFFLGMLWLSYRGVDLVHLPGWTGNPNWGGVGPALMRTCKQNWLAAASELEDPDAVYPAGWLRDLPVWEELGMGADERLPGRRVVGWAWHSWLTGLYPHTEVRQDCWYPGGPVDETMALIEMRDRPE